MPPDNLSIMAAVPRDAPGVLPLLDILAEKDNARARKLYDSMGFTTESLLL
jgi:ribosomal protein S18 acetylase RimI-like enzyme